MNLKHPLSQWWNCVKAGYVQQHSEQFYKISSELIAIATILLLKCNITAEKT